MRELTTAYIAEKNRLETRGSWCILVELEVNPSSTAYFTSHTDTFTWNSRVYRPIPMQIGPEAISADASLPSLNLDCSNVGGEAFRFAKDNDLALNDCMLRTVNTTLTTSGMDARCKLQVAGMVFNEEVARFNLSLPINTEIAGPKRIYDRSTFKSIPYGFRQYAIIVH